MIRPPWPPAPRRFPGACAPVGPDDDPAVARAWLIESAPLRVRWGAVAAIALLPMFSRGIPGVPPVLLALGLGLSNAALARLCSRGSAPGNLRAMRRYSTALEWAGRWVACDEGFGRDTALLDDCASCAMMSPTRRLRRLSPCAATLDGTTRGTYYVRTKLLH